MPSRICFKPGPTGEKSRRLATRSASICATATFAALSNRHITPRIRKAGSTPVSVRLVRLLNKPFGCFVLELPSRLNYCSQLSFECQLSVNPQAQSFDTGSFQPPCGVARPVVVRLDQHGVHLYVALRHFEARRHPIQKFLDDRG